MKPQSHPIQKVFCYVRVSTEQQRDNYSVEQQREDALSFAKAHGDAEPEIFDDVWSGRDVSRDGWQGLLARISKGGAAIVWGAAFDRLARNTIEGLQFAHVLLEHKIQFWVAGTRYDLTDHNVMLMVTLQFAIADRESSVIRKRTLDARIRSANAGTRKVPNVLGYDPVFVDGKKTYRINDKEAELVRYIFRLFDAEHLSFRAIAHRLNDEGYVTKLAGKARKVRKGELKGSIRRMSGRWQSTTVSKMLRNPEYIGMTGNWDGDQLVSNSHYEPILERALWDHVQAKIAIVAPQRNRNGVRPAQHPLSGILHCAKCGATYYHRGPQGRNVHCYYFHKNDTAAQKACKSLPQYARAEVLHSVMDSLYLQAFANEGELETMMSRLSPKKSGKDLAGELGRFGEALKSLRDRRRTIQEGYEAGLYSKTEGAEKIADIEHQIRDVEARRERIQKQQELLGHEVALAMAQFTKESLREYVKADGEGKYYIFRRVLKSLTLADGTCRVEWITGRVDSFAVQGSRKKMRDTVANANGTSWEALCKMYSRARPARIAESRATFETLGHPHEASTDPDPSAVTSNVVTVSKAQE